MIWAAVQRPAVPSERFARPGRHVRTQSGAPVSRRAAPTVLLLALSTGLGAGACGPAGVTQPATPVITPVNPTSTMSAGVDARADRTGPALSALAGLPVKGRAPKTGYDRSQFGPAWSDDVRLDGGHNGCDTRSDVLRRDLQRVVLKPRTRGCVPASGVLADPYTGTRIHFVRGVHTSSAVQVDHVVALSDAWQKGARKLSASRRRELANDPLNLLAADGPANMSKGDGDAATWLPPNRAFRCAYVARQVAVKAKYHLWVTAAEKASMTKVLASCPGQPLPTATGSAVPEPVR